ncbi:TetR family transcriptional regulator [Actinoallomurus purpureus]|uniref:TetR family transcriptional regulator n=1 Tax=Actinoallomurus purpureus TaxID=478114 RepID=UPI0020924926|nr:TetR family transcriptional regulator [Actinoallomurus purpureus]MCO6003453.1 TetR family transcriptional regulator [Actinoallomurus purpureus]
MHQRRRLHEDLLDAAAGLIIERGFRGVRMQDVADAVGVSRQTVYNEFGDKWGLAQALNLRENERYLDGVDAALSDHADLYSAVAAAVSYTLRTAADDPLKKATLTGEGSGDLLPLMTTRAEPVLFAARERIVSHAVRQWPELDAAEVAEIADVVIRLTMSHVMLPTDPVEVVAERLARLVARYLRAPIRSEAGGSASPGSL